MFHPDAEARGRMRRQWGFGERERVIGLVGRLDPMKGHDVFLQAAARFSAERPEVRFVCVGDGPSAARGRLESLGRDLGLADHILWLPARKDLVPVYNALDLATSASIFGEGFPNVVAEAMACGVLCIVTNVGDSAVVVGDAGIVVPRGDPVALVEGWRRGLKLLVDPARPDGRARVEREFGLARLVDRTEQVLATLVGAPGRGTV